MFRMKLSREDEKYESLDPLSLTCLLLLPEWRKSPSRKRSQGVCNKMQNSAIRRSCCRLRRKFARGSVRYTE